MVITSPQRGTSQPAPGYAGTVPRGRGKPAGVGPSFPITGYDDLTVSQVDKRLGSLSGAELRKVRDYEKRHANRKTVLSAIQRKLGS